MKILASILDADFRDLQAQIDSVATVDRFHLDVMDGHFVPPLSFGAHILRDIQWSQELEVHLMVGNPADHFDAFADLGATRIIFHAETAPPTIWREWAAILRGKNISPGLAIDAPLSIKDVPAEMYQYFDQVLIMSVKAGKGGQPFQPQALEKVAAVKSTGFSGELTLDGGVNSTVLPQIKAAGVDSVVVGSALMKLPLGERSAAIQAWQQD